MKYKRKDVIYITIIIRLIILLKIKNKKGEK